jgi:hypothetical protein
MTDLNKMKVILTTIILLGPVCLLPACGTSSGTGDAGLDADGMDADGLAEDGLDGGADDIVQPPDQDLGDDFGIFVPGGCQACSMCGGREVFLEYGIKARLSFRPGLVRLPRDVSSLEVDLIEKVELGPERGSYPPDGPGIFTRTLEGTSDNGLYRYEYHQAWMAGGQPFEVRFETVFEVVDGQATEQTLTLDIDTLSIDAWNNYDGRFRLESSWGDGLEPQNQLQRYSTCDYSRFPLESHAAQVEGGDTLILNNRFSGDVIIAGAGICPNPLQSAVLTRNGQEHRVDDDVRLLSTRGSYHCWSLACLVVFDQPVDIFSGLLVEGTEFGQLGNQLKYLDANLNVAETHTILSWQ